MRPRIPLPLLALTLLSCAAERGRGLVTPSIALAATAPAPPAPPPPPVEPVPSVEPVAPAEPPAPLPALVRFVVRDPRGRALPVRALVRGIEGTADPMLGPVHEARGAGTVMVAVDGRGELRLPPGRYALTFSHGPEWSLATREVDLREVPLTELQVTLEHLLPLPDWTACDLHVHARPSFDSQVTVTDRVASLVAEGIEFATPTEHNLIGDYTEGVEALPRDAAGGDGASLAWVPAVEVTTDGARLRAGHFNVYPYLPDPQAPDGAPPPFREPPREIFRAARANNPEAIIQINHPRMAPGIGYFDLVQLDPRTNRAGSDLYDPGYDAIEVFNGFFLTAPAEVDRVMHDWFALLGSGARYVGTASSDSHTIAYQQAGYPRTYVYTPGAGDRAPAPSVVLRALREGRAFGTSGPMLFLSAGERRPGDTVRTRASRLTVRVRVLAAPWIDVGEVSLFHDGVLLTTLAVPPSDTVERLDRTFTVPLRRGRSFLVATARGERPLDAVLPVRGARPFAFTNPLWIERGR